MQDNWVPGTLIEAGYSDNAGDEKKFKDPTFIANWCEAIAEGLYEYYK